MSGALARFIYRFRVPLTIAILAGAVAMVPRVQITHIDNCLLYTSPSPRDS